MPEPTFELAQDAIQMLFPLHVAVSQDGTICSVGTTLSRILGTSLDGALFFQAFSVEKPRSVSDFDQLRKKSGAKLHISAKPTIGDPVAFRGVATELGVEGDRLLIDLSFGATLGVAVKRFSLSSMDFRINDAAIDLLYTFETQQALLEDSRKLADALSHAKDDAERKAYLDPLTSIANCRALHGHLDKILVESDRRRQFAIFLIDLDHFKAINDTYGHAAGDDVLRHTADCLSNCGRGTDLPVRIGGDEFALVLTDAPDSAALLKLARKLQQRLCQPISYDGVSLKVGASVGIAQFHAGQDVTTDTLLRHADIALYAAKEERDAVKLLTPAMILQHQSNSELLREIEKAIDEEEFVPFFQPQIDGQTNRLCGFEVLARWCHPENGLRPPAVFLETAIQTNLMSKIDKLVRKQAMRTFAKWNDGKEAWKLSFNLTAQNLRSPNLVEQLLDELLFAGLRPEDIRLELLESILFETEDDYLRSQAHDLLDAGFSLALDDFGTGHASIATLIDVPVSMLKIDRSFVTGLDRNPRLQRITGSILAMASGIGMDVLAEGVETADELAFLRQAGCRYFQGYYYSAPLQAEAMEQWVTDFHRDGSAETAAG